jgi:hypothetical protein
MKTVAAQHNSTHNPEVAGSNPVPATKKPGQRIFPLAWPCFFLGNFGLVSVTGVSVRTDQEVAWGSGQGEEAKAEREFA